jgi:ribonuclease HII
MESMLFDLNDEKGVVCGLDEAGRGPLAGPVVAAAVVLPAGFPIEILGDSKQLSEKQRLEAEIIIKEQALAWAVACATAQEIDKINILQASLLAMKRAYEKVKTHISIDTALVDGNQKPALDCTVQAIVRGDATIPEIMAASILAKNQRDRYMVLCDAKWPLYHFAKHKGYPTRAHLEALAKLGPSPVHRRSFGPVRRLTTV